MAGMQPGCGATGVGGFPPCGNRKSIQNLQGCSIPKPRFRKINPDHVEGK